MEIKKLKEMKEGRKEKNFPQKQILICDQCHLLRVWLGTDNTKSFALTGFGQRVFFKEKFT